MRDGVSLPAGLASALFGRMVTSDTDANITAPVHVAHAFTVHAEEAESDYFTAVDDLSGEEPGADTIQETELTSGLFYGYVVVDVPMLLSNLGGDTVLAGRVMHNLIYLIAEVSPGAKLGSTAPYGRASFMLLEAGDRQPRSLAEAYPRPLRSQYRSSDRSSVYAPNGAGRNLCHRGTAARDVAGRMSRCLEPRVGRWPISLAG